VTLAPSLTEIAFALGAGPRVVGVDDYSDRPDEARALPHVGSYLSPSFEDILALHPDLVLAQGIQAALADRLRSSGIDVVTVDIDTISDLEQGLGAEGAALGEPVPAQHLIDDVHTALARASELPAMVPRPRVLVVVDREPGSLRGLYAAGPGSYLDELLHDVGADNAMDRLPAAFVKIDVEDAVGAGPDIILDLSHTTDAPQSVADWDPLAEIPAVRTHRVYALTDPAFIAPGPDLPEAVASLAALLRSAPTASP
jgi:iron complex transport system substrate-binding protein